MLTLTTVVCLVVGASDGDRASKSSAAEDTVETVIQPTTRLSFIQSHAHDMSIPDMSYDAKNELSSDVKQSVSLSLFIFVY